jgi:hypothetical protein
LTEIVRSEAVECDRGELCLGSSFAASLAKPILGTRRYANGTIIAAMSIFFMPIIAWKTLQQPLDQRRNQVAERERLPDRTDDEQWKRGQAQPTELL